MKTCDACEEQWEDDFFCDKCSTKIGTYNGDDFIQPKDICLNCCMCHYWKMMIKNPICDKPEDSKSDSPF